MELQHHKETLRRLIIDENGTFSDLTRYVEEKYGISARREYLTSHGAVIKPGRNALEECHGLGECLPNVHHGLFLLHPRGSQDTLA